MFLTWRNKYLSFIERGGGSFKAILHTQSEDIFLGCHLVPCNSE
jgi:hypothetical protein